MEIIQRGKLLFLDDDVVTREENPERTIRKKIELNSFIFLSYNVFII